MLILSKVSDVGNLLEEQVLSALQGQLSEIFFAVYVGGKMRENFKTVAACGRQIYNWLTFERELQRGCIAVF